MVVSPYQQPNKATLHERAHSIILASQPTPLTYPAQKENFLRAYKPLVSLNKAL